MSVTDLPIIPSQKDVIVFKELMKIEYNVDYTDEEAADGAYNLLNFFRVLTKMERSLFFARKKVVDTLKVIRR